MHSAKLTTFKILSVFVVACGLQMSVFAQENSPYSRYALGDLAPNHNVFTRGMGGISAGVADNRSINFTNPASLTLITNTIFDIGTEIDIRTLKRTTPADKFTSANTFVSYLQMAFPLTTRKMAKKNMAWAASFGLRPITKINYKIIENKRTSIDSMSTQYEGSGGLSQVFFGTGFKYKDFSIGINAGYMFGNKDISSIRRIVNDSIFYYTSNSASKTTFGNFFINGGMQYVIALARDARNSVTKNLRVGVYGNVQQNLKANSDIKRETIYFDQTGIPIRLDSIYDESVEGTIIFPAMGGIGFSYQDASWLIGADFEYGNWASYRYYGQEDQVQNNWTFRAGTQYYPAKENTPVKKYFKFVKYRAGLFYGSDYIKLNNNRPNYGITIGTGMPLTSLKRLSYTGEYVVLNTAFEFGSRGNKQSNIRESIVRFNIGISMNASWFQKSKYH